MKTFEDIVKLDEASNNEYKGLTRYVPNGSKVTTTVGDKTMSIRFFYPISAPPLNTSDIKNIENRINKHIDLFIKDIQTEIKLSKVGTPKYLFMEGREGLIVFHYDLLLNVKTKPEGKKFKKLDDALDFYKKFKIRKSF